MAVIGPDNQKKSFEHKIQNYYLGRYIIGYTVGNLVVKCDFGQYI